MCAVVKFRMLILVVFICFLAFSIRTDAVGVLSVDLGTELLKIAIVAPGIPIEVVLNSESKRKTPTAIGFNKGERLFGSAALSLSMRCPECVYEHLPALIGKHIDHPVVQRYRERFPYHQLSYNDTNAQLLLTHPNGMSFTVQELIAMLLENARDLAERHSGIALQSCVLTVPSFFNQAERRFLIEATKLAGLDVLQLINANTAVALNFGVFRRDVFNATPQHVMFFDVGSFSTTATVVSYQVGKHRDGGNLVEGPMLTVVGVGSDPALGASNFIETLRDHMVDEFNERKRTKGDVRQSAKAMSKLTKEAARVFTVLSANADTHAQVESLFDGEDFHMKITRAKLNELCRDKFDQLAKPFSEALETSKLDLSDIQDIVLMGGGTRVPEIQALLMKLGKRSELGKSVNSDEAAVLGAAYQGAVYTPGLRVLPFAVKDHNVYPIGVDFSRASGDGGEQRSGESAEVLPASVRRVLFPLSNPFPQKRAITFNRHTDDFTFYVGYVDVNEVQASYLRGLNHSVVRTRGVSKSQQRNPGAELRGVKAHFSLDASGVLTLTGIDCLFQPMSENSEQNQTTLQKLGNKISGFFRPGSQPQEEQSQTATTDPTNDAVPATNSSEAANANSTKPESPPAPFSERIEFDLTYLDGASLSVDDFAASKEKLRSLRAADEERQHLERTMNDLESTLFNTRSLLESTAFVAHSTEQERSRLSELVSASLSWYDDQDRNTPIKQFEEKLSAVREMLLPVEHRLAEAKTRPEAFQALNKTIKEAEGFLQQMRASVAFFHELMKARTATDDNSTVPQENETGFNNPPFSASDMDALGKLIADTDSWFNASHSLVAEAPLTERPPVLTADIRQKQEALSRELMQQARRLNRWRAEVERIVRERQAAAAAAKAKAEQNTTDATKQPTDEEEDAKQSATEKDNGQAPAEKEKHEAASSSADSQGAQPGTDATRAAHEDL